MLTDKLKDIVNQGIQYIMSKSGSKKDVSIYNTLDEIQDEKDLAKEKTLVNVLGLKEQSKNFEKVKILSGDYLTYIIPNFLNKLFIIKSKDYKTGKTIYGFIRGTNKIEASNNAKRLYKLEDDPDSVIETEVNDKSFFDKIVSNPTFLFKKKVKKGDLAEFLIEYSSLMEDGFEKKDAIDILKDIIKDKGLLDFMEELKQSNLKMSNLMEKTKLFDDYTISIVESAELSGGDTKLYNGLTSLGISYRDEDIFRKNFIKSLYYPGFLISLIFIIIFGTITKLIPILAGLFIEIVGEDGLPPTLIYLLDIKENLLPILFNIGIGIFIIVVIRYILFTNSIVRGLWNQFKLRLPLIGTIVTILEENRVFRILIQTKTSNLSEVQKINAFEKATSNELYKGAYRYMSKKYPGIRNMTRTIEITNNDFGGKIYGKRMLTVLNLAKGETNKIISKYEAFLVKNTNVLYDRLKKVNLIITILSTVIIGLTIIGIFALVFGLVISLSK